MKKDDREIISRWEAPPRNDARILGMPNIHPALFSLAPRTVMGNSVWNIKRKRCYFDANYKCEICGKNLDRGQAEAHEYYTTDYKKGIQEFVRLICVCHTDHSFIHSGRMLSAYKRGDKYTSKKVLLDTVEHGFSVISEWNKTHEEKIKVYDAIRQYTKVKELKAPVENLVKKYGIEFYSIPPENEQAPWSEWRLIYQGREYETPYKDKKDLEAKLAEKDIAEGRRRQPDNLKGGVFDEIDKLIDEEK